NMSHMIMSTRAILPTLQWWSNLDNLNKAMPFTIPTPSATVTMDASLEGWGGHVTVEGVSEISMYSNLWSYQESRLHINFLELCSVRLTLELMTTKLRNRHV
ncbi:MAG: hypothetical protein GY702_29360, partial [Desulfobulbaceae bacterium]|nr:hypothetical protein [Desulfobulbaceae bacterium]